MLTGRQPASAEFKYWLKPGVYDFCRARKHRPGARTCSKADSCIKAVATRLPSLPSARLPHCIIEMFPHVFILKPFRKAETVQ